VPALLVVVPSIFLALLLEMCRLRCSQVGLKFPNRRRWS